MVLCRRDGYKSMKVGIQIRTDHESKPGGDSALAKAFARRLAFAGCQAELVTTAEDVRRLVPNLFIAFNLDQSLELVDLCGAAKQCGAKIAVYALHHPRQGIRGFLQSGTKGLRRLVAQFEGYDVEKYVYTMALLRSCKRLDFRALRYGLHGRQKILGDLLPLIDYLLVSGPSELAEIRLVFPDLLHTKVFVVPHPVEMPQHDLTQCNPYKPINGCKHFIVAGRIESRKNQIAVIQIARQMPVAEFVFAGQLNKSDKRYCEEFDKLILATSNCRRVGQLDFNSLLQYLAYADAVICPSWFEVMSLINLYAYAMGTPIVSTPYTYDSDIIQSAIVRYDPAFPADLLGALNNIGIRSGISMANAAKDLEEFSTFSWSGFDEFMRAAVEIGVNVP